MFKREIFECLLHRLSEKASLIQVLSGPRQVGKTTLAQQVMQTIDLPHHYASADEPSIKTQAWLEQQWQTARQQQIAIKTPYMLVLDEVQKIPSWSEQIKHLWDEDQRHQRPIKVVILGSAPLLMQKGLMESLAGRFETIPITHWTFAEMQQAFGWTLEQFCYFGGYPGAAQFVNDEPRWRHYVLNSLIEPTLSKDVLLMQRIDKPALLRQLFYLSCDYSGQILSYQKMLGQLDDAGNTTTLSHYLTLLDGAGMVTGLDKVSLQKYKQRASSPKLQVYNTALISAQSELSFADYRKDYSRWGRLVESMVGAYLVNAIQSTSIDLFYWRERNQEIDFVLRHGNQLTGIEVKSGAHKGVTSGMAAFKKQYPNAKLLQVGGQGMALETFLKIPISAVL
jgi:predicted AAA+ superfamily ATPase